MRKLTLNLDALKVEQFQTVDQHQGARGTVMGADAVMTGPDNCVTISCGDSVRQSCEVFY